MRVNSKTASNENDGRTLALPRSRRNRKEIDVTRMRGPWVIPNDTKYALERCELFKDIHTSQLMQVAALVEEIVVEPDEMVLVEDEPARHIFVIVQGQGVAQLKLERGWVSLGLVGPSEAAGWSSLVDGQAYPASVKALTQMRIAAIEASGLTLLMNLEPEIGYPVHRRLSSIFYRQYQSALLALRTSV